LRFIETEFFPLGLVNEKSASEKQGGGRPPFWEMVFWWTRKPLASARAVIAASLLPDNASPSAFKNMVGLGSGTTHRSNPHISESVKEYFEGKRLLDPFAGFGSIPLEAMRLGLKATAVELLPTAYIFLKAVLEYPAKYGEEEIEIKDKSELGSHLGKGRRIKKLIYDVKKWGEWIIDKLKEDQDIRELYEDDVAVYIGTWEVKCPHCDRWTPIIGNYWLARVKDGSGKYRRLAFMRPVVRDDKVDIKVVDVNAIVGKVSRAKLAHNVIRIENRAFEVPEPNIEARRNLARCLLCGNEIKYVDDKGNIADNGEWYIKWALKKYHTGDERFARQRLLVKVKVVDRNLEFETCGEELNQNLKKAKTAVEELIEKGAPDIPTESIAPYDPRSIWVINYGFLKWHQLFNPRQLFILVKLVKLIREVGKKVEEERIEEGWGKEKAKGYAEAVASYLAVALTKHLDYNSNVVAWNPATGFGSPTAILRAGHTLSFRGIAMVWNFIDYNTTYDYIGYKKDLEFQTKSLEYLVSTLGLSSQLKLAKKGVNSDVKAILDDATSLLSLDQKYDIIVTDPPYADDVPYTELSDFYYVWLKRALSDSDGKKLIPRFHPEAFFRKTENSYEEIQTQWQEFARREISTNPGRFLDVPNRNEFTSKHFETLFNLAFLTMKSKLKENGLLVTYYAHTSPEAWANLLYAGWKGAKMHITNTFPIVTESAQRVTGRGKMRLDTSIIVVWRSGVSGSVRINDQSFRLKMIEGAKKKALSLLKLSKKEDYKLRGRDILIGTMGAVLAGITQYEDIRDIRGSVSIKDLTEKYVFPWTTESMFQALGEHCGEEEKAVSIEESITRYYLLLKAFFGATSNGERFERLKVSSNELIMLKLATGVDAFSFIRSPRPSHNNTYLFKKSGSKSELTFLEPLKADAQYLSSYLEERGIVQGGNMVINNSIDMFHYLSYLAAKGARPNDYEEMRSYNPRAFEEARSVAHVFSKVLLETDPEREMAENVLKIRIF